MDGRMTVKLENIWKEVIVAYLKYYTGILLK
jgi:hypothetical protein